MHIERSKKFLSADRSSEPSAKRTFSRVRCPDDGFEPFIGFEMPL